MSVLRISKESLLKSKLEDISFFEESFFSPCYNQAYDLLYDICSNYKNNQDCGDNYNNVIAFVGDRGSGKTSTMRSFANSIQNLNYDLKNRAIHFKKKCRNDIANSYYFEVLDIVEPSLFSNKESLVEIIVSTMFRKFVSQVKNSDLQEKQDLIKQFEMVFQEIKTINMDKKNVFDKDDDNLETLINLSAILNLKKDLKKLINLYMNYVGDSNCIFKHKNFLIIPIDDLDMNLAVGDKLLEDIRKYLIQDNIVILMAVNFDQLKEIVNQKFLRGLSENIKFKYIMDKTYENNYLENFNDKIHEKTQRYLDKIIPYNRRCFMPSLNLEISIELEANCLTNICFYENRLGDVIKENFYEKLSYKISSNDNLRVLIPNNLRAFLQLLLLFNSMNLNKIENIGKVMNYLKSVVIDDVKNVKDKVFLQDLINTSINHINKRVLLCLCNKLSKVNLNIDEVKNNIEYINNNKMTVFSNRITIGDIITYIKLYERIYNDAEKILFIELLKSIYSLKLLYMYYAYENNAEYYVSHNLEKVTDVIGRNFVGKYFLVTDNVNKNNIEKKKALLGPQLSILDKIENIDSCKKGVQEIKKILNIGPKTEGLSEMLLYFFTPLFTSDENYNEYVRLTRREEKNYDSLEQYNRFEYFLLNPCNLILYIINNGQDKEKILDILNLDYCMNILDNVDKTLNSRRDETEAMKEFFNRLAEEFNMKNDDIYVKCNDFINIFYEEVYDKLPNIMNKVKHNKIIKLLNEIKNRVKYLMNSKKKEASKTALLKTLNMIYQNIDLFEFSKYDEYEFVKNVQNFSSLFNNIKLINKSDLRVKEYLEWIQDIQYKLIEKYPEGDK